jgi:uncharacterized membrane protein HdeD (DUF308 family)
MAEEYVEIDYIVEAGELRDHRSPDPVEPVREFGRSWGLVLFLGIVTLAVGVVITFRPSNSVHVMAIIFGIWLLVLGVIRIIMAIAERGEGGGTRLGMAFGGLLAVLIGLLVLHHSFETVAILGFIIGVFWVVGGLSELFAGFSREAEGRRAGLIILGLIGTVVGILCLVYPGLSLSILAVILGLGLIVYGIAEIALAFQIRRLTKA